MDPTARMSRPAGDYTSRANDPGSVMRAREQKMADQLYTQPGARVPNNTLVGRQIGQELQQFDNARLSENLYRDWRGANVPGTGVDYAMAPPTPPATRMMSPQPYGISEGLGDYHWAGQVRGLPGPLEQPPNGWAQSPGLVKSAMRYPGTGQPGAMPIPPSPPAAMEDLRSAQAPFPAAPDLAYASRVDGHPAEAVLPSAGRGASPMAGGMPAVMPQPKES